MRTAFQLFALLALAASAAMAADPKPADCSGLDKLTVKNSAKAYPDSVMECARRGWEPPKGWKPNDGVNSGVRATGTTGTSVGTTTPPQVTGTSRNENASISRDRIRFSCSFPPRIKIGIPPKLKIEKGSCWDFFAGLLKDKDGKTSAGGLPPGIDEGACPAEIDTTNQFGARQAITGGQTPLECGGMLPLTTDDLILSRNPTLLATTVEGAYYIWIYRKTGNNFSSVANAHKLPSYLCRGGDESMRQKSVDLTPPVSQMIVVNEQSGFISVRLQSRASMNLGFIPPYDPDEPEKYLIIPFAADGTLTIPNDCDDEATHYTTASSQDMLIRSSTNSGCESVQANPTVKNEPIPTCPSGSTLNIAAGTCTDASGKVTPVVYKDNWVGTCASGAKPENGKCPEAAGIPPEGTCPAGSVGRKPSENCTITSTPLIEPAVCKDKTQYSVLNRPNLYYPPGARPMLYPVSDRTMFMADAIAGSEFYTQAQTEILLWPTAPTLTFKNGGILRFSNDTILLMEGPATVDIAGKKVVLANGGELTNAGGVSMQVLAEGATYAIPAAAMATLPIEANVHGGFDMPAGYLLPTTPKVDSLPAYVRLPADAPPK